MKEKHTDDSYTFKCSVYSRSIKIEEKRNQGCDHTAKFDTALNVVINTKKRSFELCWHLPALQNLRSKLLSC